MDYVVTYWLPPGSSEERADSLRDYFDVQRVTKRRIGGEQILVTNLEGADGLQFKEPDGFIPEHGIIAKWLGLGQAIEAGASFPIMMHDHDVFVGRYIKENPEAIRAAAAGDTWISDQIVVIPKKREAEVMAYIDRLKEFTFTAVKREGYGSEVRHEGRYSSELIQRNMDPEPFADTPKSGDIITQDLVSFNILGTHSLDKGGEGFRRVYINPMLPAVHGHLHRGDITRSLLDWLHLPYGSLT